jgi:hypothetical protein
MVIIHGWNMNMSQNLHKSLHLGGYRALMQYFYDPEGASHHSTISFLTL